MGLFSKTKKYRKPSRDIDEKVKSLNKELEKTGLVVEAGPANSTKHVYNTFVYHPSTEMEFSDVPDPGGVRADGWTQPSNGYNASDSSTWANAYPNTDWLFNSNEVGGETNKPVVVSIDPIPTGQTIGRFGPGAGLIRATIGYGIGLGYLKSDNTYQGILYNSYWGGLYQPTESNRHGSGAPYRGYSDEEYAFMQAAHSKMLDTTFTKEVKFWDGYSYFWHGSWENYGGPKKEVEGGGKYVLRTGWISGDPNTYQSQDNTPAYNQVISRNSISDGSYYPGNVGKFMSFLRGALDVGEKAFEYLRDKAGTISDSVKELFARDDISNEEKEMGLEISKIPEDEIQSSMREMSGFLEDPNKFTVPKREDFPPGLDGTKEWRQAKNESAFASKLSQVGTAGKIYTWYLSGDMSDGDINNDTLGDKYVNSAFQNADINQDGNIVVGDNVIGTGGEAYYDDATGEVVIPFEYDFDTNMEQIFKDPDKYDPNASVLTAAGMVAAWILGGKYGLDSVPVPGAGYATWLAKLLGGAKPTTGHEIRMSKEDLAKVNPYLLKQLENKGIFTPDEKIGSKVEMDMPSWFWYGGFGAPQWGSHKGKPVIWGTNYSGGRGYITPGGSGWEDGHGSGYGTRGYNMKTFSGGTAWTWHDYKPEAQKESPNKGIFAEPEKDKKDEKDNEWMPKDDTEVARYQRPKYVPPYVQDWDKIGPGGRNTSPDIGGNKPIKADAGSNDKGLGSVASVYNRQADATTFSAIQSKISQSSGTSSRSTGTKKKKKKNNLVASYNPNTGALLSEGWASPEHVNVDKNDRKRWFKQQDIQPEYPKDPPPEMVNGYHPKMLPKLDTPVPYIKVERKDLERSHKLKKHEAQEYVDLVNRLNNYIKRNPDKLAYVRERYPKHDPRLAELNFKMDMQIEASDEYLDKQFPENQRLFGKLMQATKRSIALTDPKTYKDKKGKMTSYKKLLRVNHVVSEYSIKERDIKNRKIGYGGKKKSVSKLLNKPIKKTNNMFGSLDVSDMKKTTAKKVNEKKIQETKLITDKKYIQDQMNILRSDWKKELNLNERMTTTGVLQYQLYGSDTDHIVVQTGYTGDGDINDFTYGNSEREAVHHGGEFTAFTAFTSTDLVDDPQNMGVGVRSFGGQDGDGNYDLSPIASDAPTGATDNMGNFWPGYTGGLRGTHFWQSYNSFPYTANGGPTNEKAVGFNEPDEPQEGILTRLGSAQLVGTGFAGNAGVPRILAMKPVDTTQMDTFSLNWFTLGLIVTDHVSDRWSYGMKFARDHFLPTAQGDGVYLYYWAGDKPGAKIYGPQMSGWGSATKNYTGWRPINRKWDGTLDPDVDPHIIPNKPNPVDENGDRLTRGGQYSGPYRGQTFFNHKLNLPEWCRGENMRFMLVQKRMSQGAAYNRWGLTSVRFQRRAPMSVAIPLDSPEASSFVRLGQSPNERTSPKQRKKKVENILKASKSYVNKVVGDPFPGTGAKIGEAQGTNEKPYVPHQWDDKRKEFGDVGTLDQQKDKFVSKDVKLAPNYSEVQNQEDPQDTEPKYPADKTSEELIKALKIPNEKDFSDRSEYNKAVEAYHSEQFDIIWEKHDPLNNPSFMANTDYTPNDTLISRMRVYISPERSATAVRQSAYMYQDPSKGYIDVMTGKPAQYQPPIDVEPTNSHNHAKIYPGSPEFSEADFRGIAPSHYWSAEITDSIAFLYQRGPDGLVYKNVNDIGNPEKGQDPKKFLKALMKKTSSLRNGMPPLSPLELVNYHRQYTTNSSKSPTGTHRPGEARYQEYISRIKEVFASNGWEHNIPEDKYSSSPPSVDVRNMTSKERNRYQASIKAKAALKDFEQSEKEYKKIFDRQRKKGIHKKGDWHGYKVTSKDARGLTKTAIEKKPRTYQNDRAERWFKVKSAADYLLGGEMYNEPKMSAYPSDTDRQMGQAAHRYLMQKQKK